MTVEEIKKHYITWTNAMRKLGFSPNTYQNWVRQGRIPLHAQMRITQKTKGEFKVDKNTPNNYELSKQRNKARKDTGFTQPEPNKEID